MDRVKTKIPKIAVIWFKMNKRERRAHLRQDKLSSIENEGILEFIPIMVYWASHARRHHVWPVYSSLMCRPALQSSWISRVALIGFRGRGI
jgi:hypothetical protein